MPLSCAVFLLLWAHIDYKHENNASLNLLASNIGKKISFSIFFFETLLNEKTYINLLAYLIWSLLVSIAVMKLLNSIFYIALKWSIVLYLFCILFNKRKVLQMGELLMENGFCLAMLSLIFQFIYRKWVFYLQVILRCLDCLAECFHVSANLCNWVQFKNIKNMTTICTCTEPLKDKWCHP